MVKLKNAMGEPPESEAWDRFAAASLGWWLREYSGDTEMAVCAAAAAADELIKQRRLRRG